MKKVVLTFILAAISFVGFSQDTTKYYISKDYGWIWKRGKFDSSLILPKDTTRNKLGIAQIGANCFAFSGNKWNLIGSTDTSFLVRYYRKNQVDSAIAANTPTYDLSDILTNGNSANNTIQVNQVKAYSSAGLSLNSNGGTQIANLGAGGGSNATFYGFTGYNSNLVGSYTSRSFTDKNYVDSLAALKLSLTGGTLSSRLTGTSLILNKDSLPTVTGNRWGLVVDTSNSNRISRRLLPIQIDSTERAYTDSIIYTGGTRPSGTTNHTYEWSRNGRLVTFRINVLFGTAGSGNTRALLPFPSVMPAPSTVTGFTVSNSSRMIPVIANGGNNTTIANSLPSAIVYNAGTPAISVDAAAQNLQVIQVSGSYFTNN
jgi:hypothetical protein